MTEEQKLDVYKFRIDVKEDDVNKSSDVLPVILYLVGYCCYAVFKKIKCKDLISERDNMKEILEINSKLQGINKCFLLYPNDATINFVIYDYVIIDKLIRHHSFLHSINQSVP